MRINNNAADKGGWREWNRLNGWLRAALAILGLSFAAQSFAYGAGRCVVSGSQSVCTVIAKIPNGAQFVLPAAPDFQIQLDPDLVMLRVSQGRWSAKAVEPANPQTLVASWPHGSGATPVAGDWDGNGFDGIGSVRRISGATRFELANLTPSGGTPAYDALAAAVYELPVVGGQPVVGDWDGNGTDSVGVYKDGVFTLINDGAGAMVFTIDVSVLLPSIRRTGQEQGQGIQATTWPWRGDGIDYVAIAFANRVSAVSVMQPGYVQATGLLAVPMQSQTLTSYDEGVLPVLLPAASADEQYVGAMVLFTPDCDEPDTQSEQEEALNRAACYSETNPNGDGSAIRPGHYWNWTP